MSEDLRTILGRWFGYARRWQSTFEDFSRAIATGRPIAITAPASASVSALSETVRRLECRVIVARADVKGEVDPAREASRAGNRSFVVIIVTAQADDVLAVALRALDFVMLRVPVIGERRDDLSQLISDTRRHAERALERGSARIIEDLPALHAYRWPGHLDEIERVVRGVVALRATGSLRRASSALGISKSTLADQLRAAGIRIGRQLPG